MRMFRGNVSIIIANSIYRVKLFCHLLVQSSRVRFMQSLNALFQKDINTGQTTAGEWKRDQWALCKKLPSTLSDAMSQRLVYARPGRPGNR
jgi:hypothetical protein